MCLEQVGVAHKDVSEKNVSGVSVSTWPPARRRVCVNWLSSRYLLTLRHPDFLSLLHEICHAEVAAWRIIIHICGQGNIKPNIKREINDRIRKNTFKHINTNIYWLYIFYYHLLQQYNNVYKISFYLLIKWPESAQVHIKTVADIARDRLRRLWAVTASLGGCSGWHLELTEVCAMTLSWLLSCTAPSVGSRLLIQSDKSFGHVNRLQLNCFLLE